MKFFFVLVVSLVFLGAISVDCARYTDPLRVYGNFAKYQGGLILEPHSSLETIDCANRHPGSLFVLQVNGDEARTHLVYCDADGKTPRIYGIEQQPSFGFSASVVEIPELFQEGEIIDQAETTAIELRYAKWVEEANQACVDTYGEQARAGKATEFSLFWNTGVGRGKDLRFTGSNPNFLAVTGDGAVIVNHEKEYGYPIIAVFADRRNGFGHEWNCDSTSLTCTQVTFSTYDSTDLESSEVTNFPNEYEQNAHVFCVASTAQKEGISVSSDSQCLDVSGDLDQLQSNADLISRYYAGWVEAPSAIPGWYDPHSKLDFNFIHGVENSPEFSGNWNYDLQMSTGSSREPWHRNRVNGHTRTLGYAMSINEPCRQQNVTYDCTDYNYVYDFESPYSQFFGYDILGADPYFRISYESNFNQECCPNGVWELGIDRPVNNTGGFNVDPDLQFNRIDINQLSWTKLDVFNNIPLIRRTDRSFSLIRYTINGKVSLRCVEEKQNPSLRKQERCGDVNLHLQIRAKPFEGAKILHKTCGDHETYTNDKLCNNFIPGDETTDDWNCESHDFAA